ncbi:replication initiation and membrane attachment family protein [Latilactobacillus graminis]|uniref:DnaD and phage-associated domain protein n=2 Tax=Latilactobacillus graminis TaxID=60519 RepID=A0AA89I019_9LACO|nr:DnaD domain protein [Latilactobacillus graminis]KRM21112.1 dnaD and phage-associated domain protein [Latilactobacillus graminis DSM 20719]QFP79239.1 helicase DnaB [Latilactobacillus graminis]
MSDAFDFLSPKDGFSVTKANYLTDFDQTVVTYLYQPLMGAVAYSLYLLLWSQTQKETEQYFQTHATLLNLLSVDLPAFYDSRNKLEALGLMRTYQKNEGTGRKLVYELYAPMPPQAFFNDDLLSVALFEAVRETRFIELRDNFKLRPVYAKDYQEVTKNFLTVFHVSNEMLTTIPTSVAETKTIYQQKKARSPQFTSVELRTFDWDLLQDATAQYQIDSDQILKYEQGLFNLHYFYGLDEMDLARLIGLTMNVADSTINMTALEQNVLNNYTRRQSKRQTPAATTVKKPLADLQKEWQKAGFNEQELQWLTESQGRLPVDYLEYLKQKNHGFVAKNEIRALKDLQNRYIFNNDVLNILVVYVITQYDGLTQALVDRIANQWAQQGVKTAADAILQIRGFKTKQTTKGQTKRSTRYQNKIKKEPVPKWAKADYQVPKEITTPENQHALEDALKKIREGRDA